MPPKMSVSVHAAGLRQFNAAGIDDCEVRRTARQTGEATYLVRANSFCSEIWREIQAQREKIEWPLISRHSCRDYPGSQDAGLILSVGEPIPIVGTRSVVCDGVASFGHIH